MAEEKTRIEKIIPDYGKLNFTNKEEKLVEDELSGMDTNQVLVWRQLESHAHMANEQLEKATDIFQGWLEEYEDVQDMIVVQKALNVIGTFGRLLFALDAERQFLLKNKIVKKIEVVDEHPENDSGRSIKEKYKKKIALLLCGERGFGGGGKGRGKLGTSQKVGDILNVDKRTIDGWINEMIENKYIGNLVKNFQELLKDKGEKLKNKQKIMEKVEKEEKIEKIEKIGEENEEEAVETKKEGEENEEKEGKIDKINKKG